MDIPFLDAFTGTEEELLAFRERTDIPWTALSPLSRKGESYSTEIKVAYSSSALIVAARCEDRYLRCTKRGDQGDLYLEDVFELFLQTSPDHPTYFEYQVSPLGAELVLLVNQAKDASFHGWSPWHYEGERRVRKEVKVIGGDAEPGASASRWEVSLVIPFGLLKGLENATPCRGTVWRGNFYRLDYDKGVMDKWMLFPVTDGQFHNYWEFGDLKFL